MSCKRLLPSGECGTAVDTPHPAIKIGLIDA